MPSREMSLGVNILPLEANKGLDQDAKSYTGRFYDSITGNYLQH